MSTEFYPIPVSRLSREGSKAVSIEFDIPEALSEVFAYESGQYLTLRSRINGESIRRAYSLSSFPGDGNRLQVAVKEVEGGKMSSYLCRDLKPGDTLELMPPMGNFTWNQSHKSLVLFAAGSGITPLISILKTALKAGAESVYLFYSNRSEAEAMFLSELDELAKENQQFKMVKLFSQQSQRLDEERTEALCREYELNTNDSDFFICGPNGMIQSVEKALKHQGVGESNIHIEYFSSPEDTSEKGSVAEQSGEVLDVTLVLDDETQQVSMNPGETFLEAGERIGIDPPFSCQSGVCTSCKAKVMQGKVEMENNFGLDQDEIDEGYVLTCIGTPASPGVIVNWDE